MSRDDLDTLAEEATKQVTTEFRARSNMPLWRKIVFATGLLLILIGLYALVSTIAMFIWIGLVAVVMFAVYALGVRFHDWGIGLR